jgi:hypothetical protein
MITGIPPIIATIPTPIRIPILTLSGFTCMNVATGFRDDFGRGIAPLSVLGDTEYHFFKRADQLHCFVMELSPIGREHGRYSAGGGWRVQIFRPRRRRWRQEIAPVGSAALWPVKALSSMLPPATFMIAGAKAPPASGQCHCKPSRAVRAREKMPQYSAVGQYRWAAAD